MIAKMIRALMEFKHQDLAMRRYLAAALSGAIPCLALMAFLFGPRILASAAVAFLSGLAVQIVFAVARGKKPGGGALVFGVLLVLMLPPATPLWTTAVGAAFAILFGQEVFGGLSGRIFNTALIGKAFLAFSYPQLTDGVYFGSMLHSDKLDAWMWAAVLTLLAAAAMAVADRANLRILLGIIAAGAATALSLQISGRLPYGTILETLVNDGFLFGACFLACDPAASPRNLGGKWLYGLIIGILAVVMRAFSNYTEGMMCAILVGNIFAPTIDLLAGPDKK